MNEVNLSRHPFANVRPVVRLAVLLWFAGTVLFAANAWLFGNYWVDSAEMRGRLAGIDTEIEVEENLLADLGEKLQGLDLDGHDAQARFLNTLIADRIFPWSTLFDDLERVLPIEVRLHSVQPNVSKVEGTERRRGSSRRRSRGEARQTVSSTEVVRLGLQGIAKEEKALFELVDNFYVDPVFHDPMLAGESRNTDGSLSFSLSVEYLLRPARTEQDQAAADGDGSEVPPAAEEPGAAAPDSRIAEAPEPPRALEGRPAEAGRPAPAGSVAAGQPPDPSELTAPAGAGRPAQTLRTAPSGRPAVTQPPATQPPATQLTPTQPAAARPPASRPDPARPFASLPSALPGSDRPPSGTAPPPTPPAGSPRQRLTPAPEAAKVPGEAGGLTTPAASDAARLRTGGPR